MSIVRQSMKQRYWVFSVLALMFTLMSVQAVELKHFQQFESPSQLVLFEHDTQDLLDVSDDWEDPEFILTRLPISLKSSQLGVANLASHLVCFQADSSHLIRAPPSHLV